jgi:hypothetical protein
MDQRWVRRGRLRPYAIFTGAARFPPPRNAASGFAAVQVDGRRTAHALATRVPYRA